MLDKDTKDVLDRYNKEVVSRYSQRKIQATDLSEEPQNESQDTIMDDSGPPDTLNLIWSSQLTPFLN